MLDRQQADLQVERDMVKSAYEQLDMADLRPPRANARAPQRQALEAESDAQKAELSLVRQQLETERAERSKLMATFQSVQHALSFAQSGDVALEPVTPEPSAGKSGRLEVGCRRRGRTTNPAPSPMRRIPVVEPYPEAAEHVKRLLEEAEAMYLADLNSGRSPVEVVDRLTGILRYARDLVVKRWGSGECDAARLFEQQITMLLDSRAETSFGRHLSISAFASRSSERPAAS